MDAKKQKALRNYLIRMRTRLLLSPPRSNSAEQVIAHYANLNGQAIAILEYAIDELKPDQK